MAPPRTVLFSRLLCRKRQSRRISVEMFPGLDANLQRHLVLDDLRAPWRYGNRGCSVDFAFPHGSSIGEGPHDGVQGGHGQER